MSCRAIVSFFILQHLLLATAYAQPFPVIYDFNNDNQGWLDFETFEPALYLGNGGNPGGFLADCSSSIAPSSLFAPRQFNFDWSSLFGNGYLQFDHFVGNPKNVDKIFNLKVCLGGLMGSASWIGPFPGQPKSGWTTYRIPLNDDSNWIVHSDSGSLEQVLRDVALFTIRHKTYGTASPTLSGTEGIDNVIISAGVLLGDINGDGQVDILDIGPFVDLLSTNTFQTEADVNGDGVVNLLDVCTGSA